LNLFRFTACLNIGEQKCLRALNAFTSLLGAPNLLMSLAMYDLARSKNPSITASKAAHAGPDKIGKIGRIVVEKTTVFQQTIRAVVF